MGRDRPSLTYSGAMKPLLAALSLAAALQACAAGPASVVVHPRGAHATTASGQPIRLPQGDVRLVLSEYVIPAGARLPVHRHPHPRIAVVQSGSIAVTNVDTGETKTYGPGEMIVESVDQWHFGVASGDAPVRLWVLDPLPAGVASNVVLRE